MSWLIMGFGAPGSLAEVNPHGLLQSLAATLSSSGIHVPHTHGVPPHAPPTPNKQTNVKEVRGLCLSLKFSFRSLSTSPIDGPLSLSHVGDQLSEDI